MNFDESTFKFIENVAIEMNNLFPYEYVHIGGDELSNDNKRDLEKNTFIKQLMEEKQ